MARLFDDGSSQYLRNTSAVLSSFPITISAWIYSDDLANNGWLVSITDRADASVNAIIGLRFAGNVAGDYLRAQSAGGTGANTTTGVSLNTWHHGVAKFISSTSRQVLIDGGSKGTDTTSVTWNTPADTYIGCSAYNDGEINYFSGRIAEVGIWDTELTDAEGAILADGYSPLFVRPQSLVAYLPLFGDVSPEADIVGGYDMTLYNSPTQANHPTIHYPVKTFFTVPDIGGMISV